MSRQTLLLLSPIVPRESGSGLAMRAFAWVNALSQMFDVYLLVIPVSDVRGAKISGALSALCKRDAVVESGLTTKIKNYLWQRAGFSQQVSAIGEPSAELVRKSVRKFDDIRFDRVHVLRSYLTPFAIAQKKSSLQAVVTVDIDDIESLTRQRMSELHTVRGELKLALALELQGRWFETYERQVAGIFQNAFVCSEPDSNELSKRGFENICILPNCVPANLPPLVPIVRNQFTFLFVGNFNYFPNQDGVEWFCREVLPILRKLLPVPFSIIFAGNGKLRGRKDLANKNPEIQVRESVPDLTSIYHQADVAIVPLRAGGGTRIKILEAWSHSVPVVSTPIGAEGLLGVDGIHLLLAKDADLFARSCAELFENPGNRSRIGVQGNAVYRDHYSAQSFESNVKLYFTP